MNTLLKLGRPLFAIPFAVFGVQYFIYGHFTGGLGPYPDWLHGSAPLAYLTGAVLIAISVCILVDWQAPLATDVLAWSYLLVVLLLHTPHLSAVMNDGVVRTRALEPLGLAAAAFVLASSLLPASSGRVWRWQLGRFIYAACMIVFGWQHFLYHSFLKTLVPVWLPGHLFFIYFTGVAFIAAALAMLSGILARLASISLGVMFLLWFLILHIPRCLAAPRNGDEWSSAFIALTFAGASFVFAAAFSRDSSASRATS